MKRERLTAKEREREVRRKIEILRQRHTERKGERDLERELKQRAKTEI